MIDETSYVAMPTLEAGLDLIRQAPADQGTLDLIVRRPGKGEREVMSEGRLDVVEGLLGDTWKERGSRRTPDGSAHPELQLTLMNSRVIRLLASDPARWPLAGDQLFVDLDLSTSNLPPGSRLSIGEAMIEVTAIPHTGCKLFLARYGPDALEFVNSPLGRQLNLRGINARVIQGGLLRSGDFVQKV